MQPTNVPRRAPVCRFGPDRRLTALTAVGALIAALSTLLASDAAGRILLGGAALVLLGYTVTDLAFWPRLVLCADGLRVCSPLARATLAWPQVDAIRADTRQRYGLRLVTLEIDAGDQLIVLSRRALGADPETVAGAAAAFRSGQAG